MKLLQEIFPEIIISKKAIKSNNVDLSYGDLIYNAKIFSMKIVKEKNNRIIILESDNAKLIIALLAIWMAHKTAIVLNYKINTEELFRTMKLCKSNALVTDTFFSREKLENQLSITRVGITDCSLKYQNADIEINPDTIALMVPTSGSTGNPKIVPLTFSNIFQKIKRITDNFQPYMNKNTKELIVVPTYSLSVLIAQILPVFSVGGSLEFFYGLFDIKKIEKIIKEESITYFGCTISMLQILFKNLSVVNWSCFKGLKGICVGGENIDKSLVYSINKHVKRPIIVPMYGLTETTSIITGKVEDDKIPSGSVGKLYDGYSIKIVNTHKEDITLSEKSGEIYIKGESLFTEYWNNKKLTDISFNNGWFKSGDIGWINNNRYLFVNGRKKRIIISGGQNIYPEEIEDYLLTNKFVQHALVKSKKHNVLGEVPVAEVILKKSSDRVTEKDIINYCRIGLSPIKVPRQIKILKKIHLIGFGKQGL